MALAASLEQLPLEQPQRPLTTVDQAIINEHVMALVHSLPAACARLPSEHKLTIAYQVAKSTEVIGEVLSCVLPHPASLMGDGMTTAASLLRGLVDKCITVDAIRATIANLVVLYCGLVERNWDFFQQHHSGMLITLNVIMVGLNDYMQQLLRRGRVRNAVMHSPLGGFDRSIKELRTNAQFSATMNVNAFVESLKQQLAARMSRRAADGHGGAGGGAEQLLTIVEEAGLDPESRPAPAPTRFQMFVALVRGGGGEATPPQEEATQATAAHATEPVSPASIPPSPATPHTEASVRADWSVAQGFTGPPTPAQSGVEAPAGSVMQRVLAFASKHTPGASQPATLPDAVDELLAQHMAHEEGFKLLSLKLTPGTAQISRAVGASQWAVCPESQKPTVLAGQIVNLQPSIICLQDISSKQYHELTKLLKKSAGTGLKAAYRGSFLLDMATLWRTDVFTDPSMLSEMTDLKLQRLVESAAKAASVDMVAAGMLTGSVAVAKTLKRDSDGSAVVAVNVCLRNARCAGGPLAVEAALLKSDLQRRFGDGNVIVTGDFQAGRGSPMYAVMTRSQDIESFFPDTISTVLNLKHGTGKARFWDYWQTVLQPADYSTCRKFQSAFSSATEEERGLSAASAAGPACRAYVWHSGSDIFTVSARREPIPGPDLSMAQPSAHLPLVVGFDITNNADS